MKEGRKEKYGWKEDRNVKKYEGKGSNDKEGRKRKEGRREERKEGRRKEDKKDGRDRDTAFSSARFRLLRKEGSKQRRFKGRTEAMEERIMEERKE